MDWFDALACCYLQVVFFLSREFADNVLDRCLDISKTNNGDEDDSLELVIFSARLLS